MPKPHLLDILILYNGNTAYSALCSDNKSPLPFHPQSLNHACNHAYAYFLKYCHQRGLTAGFTTSTDIIAPGLTSCYWVLRNNSWQKINNSCQGRAIYDKFSPKKAQDLACQQLFFSAHKAKMYNPSRISRIFLDKHNTYKSLLPHTVPTVTLAQSSLHTINLATRRVAQLAQISGLPGDFSQDLILKDRYGAGGWHVYQIKSKNSSIAIQKIMRANPKTSFILQPFALFDHGFTYQGNLTPTDIRLIYLDGKLFHSYLRFPKSGDFRCNEHQGGSSVYISEDEIPARIRVKSDRILNSLATKALIALDFIVTNAGTPYLIEGNTGPGLSWDQNNKKEVYMGKKLIRGIVDQLALQIKTASKQPKSISAKLPVWTVSPSSSLESLVI